MKKNKLENFFELIKVFNKDLKFEIFEIGAHPYNGKEEVFYKLLDFFPNSKINAFEIKKEECEKLNKLSKEGVKFHPYALGLKKEKRKFYETMHPMCSSLYEPNEEILKLYNNFQPAFLKEATEIETISLDEFIEEKKINEIDFIKIDVQGAELDIFKGAEKCLQKTLAVVSEVGFISLYKNQPLFGDISSYLNNKNLTFHKFLGISGRTLNPVVLNNDKNFATQHIWSDAIFFRDILKISKESNTNLLKLAIFSFLYGSIDLTFFCLVIYDKKK